MYIYHLYFMLQGLAALYFVVVTVPSVALDLYTSYSPTRVPASSTAYSTSGFSTIAITHGDADYHLLHISDCSTVEMDDSELAQSPNISSFAYSQSRPPLFILPPGILQQRQDREVYTTTYRSFSIPFDNIPTQTSSSMFSSSSICLLVLSMILGTMGARRFVRSSNRRPRDDRKMDRATFNWLRKVLPESTEKYEMFEDRVLEYRFVPRTDVFGLWPRASGTDVFSEFAVPLLSVTVPSRVTAKSKQTSGRGADVLNPQTGNYLEGSTNYKTPFTPLSTAQLINISHDHPNTQKAESTPAKVQRMNFKILIEPRPMAIHVPNNCQIPKQSKALPSIKHLPLVPKFGPSIFVTPPLGRTISKEGNSERNLRMENIRPDTAKAVPVCDVSESSTSNEKPTIPVIILPDITSPTHLCVTVTTPIKKYRRFNGHLSVGDIVPELSPPTPAHPVHNPEHLEKSTAALHADPFDTSSSEGSLGPITPEVPIRQFRPGTPAVIASTNPYISRVLKEFDYYTCDPKSFDNSLDKTSPTRLINRSGSFGSFPGLFASPHASASDLVTLIATPMSFPPWKFDELIPPITPLRNICPVPDNRAEDGLGASGTSDSQISCLPFTGNDEPPPRVDTQDEGRLQELTGENEWSDKDFNEQELRWRRTLQPQSSKLHDAERDFWTQFESNLPDESDQSSCWWTSNEPE